MTTTRMLYLGWVGFNNFGDEMLWRTFRDAAGRKLAPGSYELIPSVPGIDVKNLYRYDAVVLGGGSLLLPGYVDILLDALRLGKRIAIWGSGYDCFHRPKAAGQGIVPPDAVREDPAYAAKLAEAFHRASFRGVRGPWTKTYLETQGVDPALVTVSGDPGLLASPGDFRRGPKTEKWIGINWGTVYNKMYGADEAQVEEQLVRTANALLNEGYNLYLYVVWGPDRAPSERLYAKIGAHNGRVVYDPGLHTEEGYARLMSGWTATLNLKLHANVMSAVAGVPFVSLGYRFKCFDFAGQLGLPELVVSTHEPELDGLLLAALGGAIERGDEISARFADARGRTAAALESFFELG